MRRLWTVGLAAALCYFCNTARGQDSTAALDAARAKQAALVTALARAKNEAAEAADVVATEKSKLDTAASQLAAAKTRAAANSQDADAIAGLKRSMQALMESRGAAEDAVAQETAADAKVRDLTRAVSDANAAVEKAKKAMEPADAPQGDAGEKALKPKKSDEAQAMLLKAFAAMKTGLWRARKYRALLDANTMAGNYDASVPDSDGLISGDDYDVTYPHSTSAGQEVTMRRIQAGGKAWLTADGGATWKPPGDKLDFYNTLAPQPPGTDGALSYEIADTEEHDGEIWLHIRAVAASGSPVRIRIVLGIHYWLLLDNAGNPVSLRRCASADGEGFATVGKNGVEADTYDVEDFTPAKPGERIKAPEEGK